MLEVFHEREEFFQLKDLEKICPKSKGITPMSVKEVLKSLVDDDIVESDKIGLSTYYWSLVSKSYQKINKKLGDLKQSISDQERELKENIKLLVVEEKIKKPSKEKDKLTEKVNKLRQELSEIEKQIKLYQENNSEAIDKIAAANETTKKEVNDYNEKIEAIILWVRKNFPSVDINQLMQQIGIDENTLDYFE